MIAETQTEHQSDAGSTKDTPYLTLTGELWGVFSEYFWESWQCYNGTALCKGTLLYIQLGAVTTWSTVTWFIAYSIAVTEAEHKSEFKLTI